MSKILKNQKAKSKQWNSEKSFVFQISPFFLIKIQEFYLIL